MRAASIDREMLGALGVNQAWLFTGVFFVGAFLGGTWRHIADTLQMPRMLANLSLDLDTIGNAFVVVVVGGMGSIPGAFVAALLIAEIKALCIGIGHVSMFGTDFSLSKHAGRGVRRDGGRARAASVGTVRTCASHRTPCRTRRYAFASLHAARQAHCLRRGAVARARATVRRCLSLHARADGRDHDCRAVCREPAFHHGTGRHAFVRSCGIFRAGRLWRGDLPQGIRVADGRRADNRAARCGHRRAGVRLVLRAFVRCLSCDAHARVRPDRVVGCLSMGCSDRRQQRHTRFVVRAVDVVVGRFTMRRLR